MDPHVCFNSLLSLFVSKCPGTFAYKWPGQLNSQLYEAGLKMAFPLGCYVACREVLWKCREEAEQRVMWFDGWQDEHVFVENSL